MRPIGSAKVNTPEIILILMYSHNGSDLPKAKTWDGVDDGKGTMYILESYEYTTAICQRNDI